jgi:hypothetical protein
MAQVWREFEAALRESVKEGPSIPVTPPAPLAPPLAAPPAEEEGIPALILNYLAEHAEGAKLVDLEPVLGLARLQLGKHLRNLVDSGKVVKDPGTLIYKLA